jgi:hypothetical protein
MDPISAVAGLLDTAINRLWPDPAARASAEAQLMKAQAEAAIAAVQQQIDINKLEAVSPSVFVAGWRPFIGWVCGSAFAMHYLLLPLANWLLGAFGQPPVAVAFDMETLLTVLGGMLGLAALRTVEKVQKVTR